MQSEATLQTDELTKVAREVNSLFVYFCLNLNTRLQWSVVVLPPRSVQMKTLLGLTAPPSSVAQSQKPRPKQSKPKAEPPPKKRKKWKEEFAASESSAEEGGEEDGEEAFWLSLLV